MEDSDSSDMRSAEGDVFVMYRGLTALFEIDPLEDTAEVITAARFGIIAGDGRLVHVDIKSQPTCDCEGYRRAEEEKSGRGCSHIRMVLQHVVGLSDDDTLRWERGVSEEETRRVLSPYAVGGSDPVVKDRCYICFNREEEWAGAYDVCFACYRRAHRRCVLRNDVYWSYYPAEHKKVALDPERPGCGFCYEVLSPSSCSDWPRLQKIAESVYAR